MKFGILKLSSAVYLWRFGNLNGTYELCDCEIKFYGRNKWMKHDERGFNRKFNGFEDENGEWKAIWELSKGGERAGVVVWMRFFFPSLLVFF